MESRVNELYDVVVVGGAFSGASTALLLRRERPQLRILIVERSEHFDRKVGEATTEISGCFLTKRLAMNHHLNHHHVPKHGLRFWFSQSADDSFGDCGELGGFYQTRLPTFQVDREVLDEYLLAEAVAAGAELLRPARVKDIELGEKHQTLHLETVTGEHVVSAKFLVDASGRAGVLSRKLDLRRSLPAHPTRSIWARFRGVKDWDGYELKSRFPGYANSCQVSRATATNHLTGYGWWCWIIPLKGGDYSAGIVFDERLYTPPAGATPGDRLKAHLLSDPVGREIFGQAEIVEGDVKSYAPLPYYVDQVAGRGWQIVGDAAGFLDPLYSAGLDYCSWTVTSAVNRIEAEMDGSPVDVPMINKHWLMSYHGWFNALYRDKYYYLGDKELMTAAMFMDLGLFFFGPVRSVVYCLKYGFGHLPFTGPMDSFVCKLMAFYNRRLAHIARKRHAAGVYGSENLRSRTLIAGFAPTPEVLKIVWRGVKVWLRAELRSARLPAVAEKEIPAPAAPAALS